MVWTKTLVVGLIVGLMPSALVGSGVVLKPSIGAMSSAPIGSGRLVEHKWWACA